MFPVDDAGNFVGGRIDEYIGCIEVGMCQNEFTGFEVDEFVQGVFHLVVETDISSNILWVVPSLIMAMNVNIPIFIQCGMKGLTKSSQCGISRRKGTFSFSHTSS